MNRLWIKKISCNVDTAIEIASSLVSFRPSWYLHGTTVLSSEGDECTVALWAEGDCDEVLERFRVNVSGARLSDLTEEEQHSVLTEAMLLALRISVHPNTSEDIGEALLRRNPECRQEGTPEEAVIAAALAERKKNFTEEDYERE